jgi:DNA-binding transcriptional ArsR family regulator
MEKVKVVINNEKLQYASELSRALAHPLRLKILDYIDTHGEINVNKIYKALDIEQSITSQHLKVLRVAGVLEWQKDGKYVHYKIRYDVIERACKAVNRFLKKS